jgi:hypothetical protein
MQFGLRSLLVFVTVCCMLLALPSVMGQLWALGATWLVLLIAVHVAANAWGTRLRKPGGPATAAIEERPLHPETVVFAPTSRLRQRSSLSWLRFAASAVLACLAGAFAVYLMVMLDLQHIGYGSIAVAGVSAAIIGGLLGFLGSSFLEEALRSWNEATRL